jgi:hypothetical protein
LYYLADLVARVVNIIEDAFLVDYGGLAVP